MLCKSALILALDRARDAAHHMRMHMGDFLILTLAVALAGYAALMFAPRR